jgi:hypothetical protein
MTVERLKEFLKFRTTARAESLLRAPRGHRCTGPLRFSARMLNSIHLDITDDSRRPEQLKGHNKVWGNRDWRCAMRYVLHLK